MVRSLTLVVPFVFLPTLLMAQQTSQASSVGEAPAQATPLQQTPSISGEKPRVFITDSQSWEMEGSAGGGNGAFAARSRGGARPQTAEIVKTFGQRCPGVIVNNKEDIADFIVVLDHEGGKGWLQHKDKVAVFQHVSGDVVISHSTLSLGGSVEDACKGIAADWAAHGAELLAAKVRPAATSTGTSVSVASPNSPTISASLAVQSTPAGADIEIDGNFVGNAPSTVSVAPGSHQIVVKKKGFADWSRTLNVTGGTISLNATLDAVSN